MYFSRCFYAAPYQAQHIILGRVRTDPRLISTQRAIKATGIIVYTGIMHVLL